MQARLFLITAVALLWSAVAQAQSAQLAPVFIQPEDDGRIALNIGIARLMMLDQPAVTIVIGDTSVADTALLDDRMLILTAKRPGSTNLVVLGENNDVVLNSIIIVELSGIREVNIRRGTALQSYVCFESAGCQTGTIPRLPETMFTDDAPPQNDLQTEPTEVPSAGAGRPLNQPDDG